MRTVRRLWCFIPLSATCEVPPSVLHRNEERWRDAGRCFARKLSCVFGEMAIDIFDAG